MAKKVLVVDDDANTVKFLSAALEQNGYQPITAFNGKEGWEKIESENPDLVLLEPDLSYSNSFVGMRNSKHFP